MILHKALIKTFMGVLAQKNNKEVPNTLRIWKNSIYNTDYLNQAQAEKSIVRLIADFKSC